MRVLFSIVTAIFVIGGGGLAAALVIPASPVYQPTTGCRVTEGQYERLAMKIGYDETVRAFGCEGVRIREERFGDVTMVEYGWRADAWPFGAVRGRFYNDALHAKSRAVFGVTWSNAE